MKMKKNKNVTGEPFKKYEKYQGNGSFGLGRWALVTNKKKFKLVFTWDGKGQWSFKTFSRESGKWEPCWDADDIVSAIACRALIQSILNNNEIEPEELLEFIFERDDEKTRCVWGEPRPKRGPINIHGKLSRVSK